MWLGLEVAGVVQQSWHCGQQDWWIGHRISGNLVVGQGQAGWGGAAAGNEIIRYEKLSWGSGFVGAHYRQMGVECSGFGRVGNQLVIDQCISLLEIVE